MSKNFSDVVNSLVLRLISRNLISPEHTHTLKTKIDEMSYLVVVIRRKLMVTSTPSLRHSENLHNWMNLMNLMRRKNDDKVIDSTGEQLRQRFNAIKKKCEKDRLSNTGDGVSDIHAARGLVTIDLKQDYTCPHFSRMDVIFC